MTKEAEKRKGVLLEAHEAVRGERAKFYGDPRVNLRAIAEGWSAYLRARLTYLGVEVPADADLNDLDDPYATEGSPLLVNEHDVCELMILLKAMRGARGYHRDSATDAGGYADLDEIVSDGDAYFAFADEAGL